MAELTIAVIEDTEPFAIPTLPDHGHQLAGERLTLPINIPGEVDVGDASCIHESCRCVGPGWWCEWACCFEVGDSRSKRIG